MQPSPDRSPLHRLFNPQTVALFGASEASDSVGAKVWSNLVAGGFDGRLFAVNPKHQTIDGAPCFASVLDVPGDIDLAVIATPAHTIAAIIEECANKRVGNAIVLSAGFVEAGSEGLRLHKKLLATARHCGIRFLTPPAQATVKALNEILPSYWSQSNPLDILGDASPEHYRAAVRAALADPNFDGVLVMLTPQAMTGASEVARAIVQALPKKAGKPVLACWMGESSVAGGRAFLSANGVPDFTTPEAAVEAFSYLAQHARHRELMLETPVPRRDDSAADLDGARMIIEAALGEGRAMLSGVESKALLCAFGIPISMTIEAASPASALVAAEIVGFPVAMKINSPDITHKSDVGGVRTNVMNAADVKLAFREIAANVGSAHPDAKFLGVTVEAMAHVEDARELVIGASRDAVFGPTILFGAGGTMVEVLRDSAVSLPPLSTVLANRLINRTRVSRLLDAFRDRPAVDRDAVVDVLLRISDLVCDLPEVLELDINPLFAGPGGVIAVDARIAITRAPAGAGPYDHVAIQPFPRHLVCHDHLGDGTPLTIRPIRPEDAESEQTFVRELSPQARQFRFMGTLNELSREMLVRFTQIDYRREMALVAIVEHAGIARQHGVARYVINPDLSTCEFALVVSDELRKQGIGTRLMKALMESARDEHGLRVMAGTVLARNAPMLQLMADLGFSISSDPDDIEVRIVERAL